MPAIIESSTEISTAANRRDSTFTYEPASPSAPPSAEEMERLRATRSSEHLRTDSVDSGIEQPQVLLQAPAVRHIKRVSSKKKQLGYKLATCSNAWLAHSNSDPAILHVLEGIWVTVYKGHCS